MKSLLILFTLLGLGACRHLEVMTEDAMVEEEEEASASEPCEKMNISDTTWCPVRGIQSWRRFGNTCYKLFTYKFTFNRAESFCSRRIRRGHLASIHRQQLNRKLRRLFPCGMRHVWVGGRYLPQRHSYVWTDGTAFNYRNWFNGHPRYHCGKRSCLVMNRRETWNNWDCQVRQSFICEYRLSCSEGQEEECLEDAD
ncbi:struthiocalcin-2-like [Pleurodeles waltl]